MSGKHFAFAAWSFAAYCIKERSYSLCRSAYAKSMMLLPFRFFIEVCFVCWDACDYRLQVHRRDFDFAGQQQVALKLHKLAGAHDEFYVWWAIVATALQAKAAIKGRSSALPAEKLLQLAEVMVAKQAQRGGIQTYEQLMLYIDVLQVCFHIIQTVNATQNLLACLLAKLA